MAHTARGWLGYLPSKATWSSMSIKTDLQTAVNNGASLNVSPPFDNYWPLHHSDLRAVYGKDAARYTDSCIVIDPAGTLFNLGATFNDEFGNVYTVVGLRQERFRTRNLK